MASCSPAYRIAHTYISWQFRRYFYYGAFFFETASVVASGLGYNGREEAQVADPKQTEKLGDHKWDKIIGAYIFGAETSCSANDFFKYWNYRYHVWSKHYNLERIVETGKKPTLGQVMTIYVISAFWHGWYPMYYMGFLIGAITTVLHRDAYMCWYLFRNVPRPLKYGISWIFTQFAVNYGGLALTGLTLENGMIMLSYTYYAQLVILAVMILVFRVFGLVSISRKMERKAKEAAEGESTGSKTGVESSKRANEKKTQ